LAGSFEDILGLTFAILVIAKVEVNQLFVKV